MKKNIKRKNKKQKKDIFIPLIPVIILVLSLLILLPYTLNKNNEKFNVEQILKNKDLDIIYEQYSNYNSNIK